MRISFTTYNHKIDDRNHFLANQKQSHSSKILVFFCKSFMIVLKRALEFIYLFCKLRSFCLRVLFLPKYFCFSRSTGNWIGNWQGSFRWKQRSAFDLSYSWESNSYGKSSLFWCSSLTISQFDTSFLSIKTMPSNYNRHFLL